MKGETIAVNVLAPLKEFYQQLNTSFTSVSLDISNYKKINSTNGSSFMSNSWIQSKAFRNSFCKR